MPHGHSQASNATRAAPGTDACRSPGLRRRRLAWLFPDRRFARLRGFPLVARLVGRSSQVACRKSVPVVVLPGRCAASAHLSEMPASVITVRHFAVSLLM